MSSKEKDKTTQLSFFSFFLHAFKDDYLSRTDDSNWHMPRHVTYCHDELMCGCSYTYFIFIAFSSFEKEECKICYRMHAYQHLDYYIRWETNVFVYMNILTFFYSFRCFIYWREFIVRCFFIRMKIIIMNKRWVWMSIIWI
jgi:hypothetical protein